MVLAVNYFVRFIPSLMFRKDKPWMEQLTVVACLSLAAKVEETQVEESKPMFDSNPYKEWSFWCCQLCNGG
ncbi:hypothetical protein V6N13_127090 [Hibiscus sabdariffa]